MSDESSQPSRPEASRHGLETLRHQRALIAGHLAWLDREIADLEGREKEHGNPSPRERETVSAPNAKERTVDARAAAQLPKSTHLDPLPEEFTSPERARAAGRQNARSIQAGCILMGVIAVIAFFVLFFVVPHFVY